MNILLNTLAILIFFALWAAHRRSPDRLYAAAGTDALRVAIEAAGLAMLFVGQSHTPGTFPAFFLLEAAGVMMSAVMLHSGIFSKAAAIAGLLGFGMLLVFEFFSSFVFGLGSVTMILAILGGLLTMVWYILIARRLFRLEVNSESSGGL